MGRLMRWYQRMAIKDQIRCALILLSVCSAVILGALSFGVSKYTIEKNYKEFFTYNLKISNQIADIQMDNLIELSRNLLNNARFMTTLKESNENQGKYFSSTQSHILESVCSATTSQDMNIGEIVVMDRTGKLYSYATNMGESRNYRSLKIEDSDWISQIEEAKGKEVFFGWNVFHPERETTFSMGKQINSPKNGEFLGYIIVNIRKELLQEAFKIYNKGYESLCCMALVPGAERDIAYLTGKEKYQKEIKSQYEELGIIDKSYVTAELHNSITGWKMVSAVKKSELTRESLLIGCLICMIILLLVALSSAIARHISEWIYRPLHKLEGIIEEVGEGNRNITEEFDDSEIGRIGTKFKTMVNYNLELREHLLSSQLKEREAELLLLQSQINPHFLYNTLDSLYCMAVIHEADDMAEMVEALSKIFRLSLNKGNKLILAKDEVEHVCAYMKVQNFRYGERFALDVQVDDEVQSCYILKFILQPFVENAMYHGLEPKMGNGTIKVTGKKTGDDLLFTVEDDGVGIGDTSVLENGYGVKNVRERISMYYGEGYGVTFESRPSIGTKVTIKISAVYTKGEILDEKSSHSG
ncbi:MAG: sensor histidine kinase [Eubacteriales bacterium]|nr:sensor histidine kinase [Eubacteriales bacterium]